MNSTVVSVVIALAFVGGTIYFTRVPTPTNTTASGSNVSIVDGQQIIKINAKGGYFPVRSMAKANVPTVLRFETNGTFDCSSSVSIPSMNVIKNLVPTGTTDIVLANTQVGTLQGTCGMGMYPFEIDFQS